jgi:epoxyqueuosine reductase
VTFPLKQTILNEAHRLGFILAGVTTPDPPPHLSTFEGWLSAGRHADMAYLASETSRARRADPRQILPECLSILVLGIPYNRPPSSLLQKESSHSSSLPGTARQSRCRGEKMPGQIASYALGDDYHLILPERLKSLVAFIEAQVGHPIPNRYYTDSGPLLERGLAQRAGLGWIGKNTCLIQPRAGS